MVSLRKVYGETLAEIGAENKNVVVLDADLAKSTMTGLFAAKFPDRFFDIGIAEQDMICTAAGLANYGKIAFASSFAIFATGRAWEQIRNSICYPKLPVKIVATHAGVTVGPDGGSHQALEDIAIMRAIPNMKVIVPSDAYETASVIKRIVSYDKGPVYVRLGRDKAETVFDDTYQFS
ncbi:MAG: transketolase family protein, partial [Spirochaetes bacterium]|nr:transketolase family protein [Spirochaetota bacterium]